MTVGELEREALGHWQCARRRLRPCRVPNPNEGLEEGSIIVRHSLGPDRPHFHEFALSRPFSFFWNPFDRTLCSTLHLLFFLVFVITPSVYFVLYPWLYPW